jgi:tetratricopeptide (TPR) repeat protein
MVWKKDFRASGRNRHFRKRITNVETRKVNALRKHKRLLAMLLIIGLVGASPLVRAKELSGYLYNYYYNMGLKVLSYGFRALAGEHFKQVLTTDPDNFEVRLLWTMILVEEGELDNALAQCAILRKNPEADQTIDLLEAQIRQGLGQIEAARALYEKALSEDDELALAHLGMAQIWALEGKTSQAEEAYKKVVELSADRLDAYLELAQLQQKNGKLEEAIGTLKDGIAINRQWAPFHSQLALVLQEAGKHDEAKVAMERARQLDPDLVAGEARN